LTGTFALGPDEFNDFSPAHLLLRDEETRAGVPQHIAGVLKAVSFLYTSRTKM
jgi:hypothetical protein